MLISQVQRSGGTLLSQLFDGHPEVHAHPGELHIGPGKSHWPALDPDEPPEAWFDALFERITLEFVEQGYSKTTRRRPQRRHLRRVPVPLRPRAPARDLPGERAEPGSTGREILDAYMTSYFNAWLDNANLRTGPKRVVTAFSAAAGDEQARPGRLLRDYPDGTLITIVREPRGWFESSRRYTDALRGRRPRRSRPGAARRARRCDARERYGDRVMIVSFEQLVRETEPLMRRLAERLGLTFSDELLVPTFNGQPIRADSSGAGAPVRRDRGAGEPCPSSTRRPNAAIARATDELYARARSVFLEP